MQQSFILVILQTDAVYSAELLHNETKLVHFLRENSVKRKLERNDVWADVSSALYCEYDLLEMVFKSIFLNHYGELFLPSIILMYRSSSWSS